VVDKKYCLQTKDKREKPNRQRNGKEIKWNRPKKCE